ncbi:MAG TPA: hypothetical protein VHB25_03685 [Gemmatimonadaceae bacterium]|nr:hypothetical protein [Gemmatimonadaceae bacterium]
MKNPPSPVATAATTPASTARPTAGTRSLSRILAELFPDSSAVEGERALELSGAATEPPRLISATIIEGHELRARRIFEAPAVGFAAFLDGKQDSVVEMYRPGGIPIVRGRVGAVIRDRRNQRLFTWRHLVEEALYVPRAHVRPADWERLVESGLAIRDTTDGEPDASEHPLALREAAIHRVQKDRELVEQRLALEWCERENRPLLIDGGISGAEQVARAACAIGVIKSHRTLYARGDALEIVLALGRAERSSVFLVTSPKRASVASWYLRMRDPRGHDPMWGLVRVEVAAPAAGAERDIGARADEVSRWILAEAAPVALPDGRWDKMVYGVRDCEEFLRAVM